MNKETSNREYLIALEGSEKEFRQFVITKLMNIEHTLYNNYKWENRFYKVATMAITAALTFIAIRGGV